MKKYFISFFIISCLLIPSAAQTQRVGPPSECPPPTSSVSSSVGASFSVYNILSGDISQQFPSFRFGITYVINEAVVLVDEHGNIINPSQSVETKSGKYTLKAIRSGEYYECGGYTDSPPITFGDKPVYSLSNPRWVIGINGVVAPPRLSDSVFCTYSGISVLDNGALIATSPSKEMTEVSFNLNVGNHNIQISRDIECKYSFKSVEDSRSMAINRTVFVEFSSGEVVKLNQNDYVKIPSGNRSTPLEYSLSINATKLNVNVTNQNVGLCESRCKTGYICCENECRNYSKGICKDINGDEIPDWIPYSSS